MSEDHYSHLLLTLSQPCPGQEKAFREWYTEQALKAVNACQKVVSVRHYLQHPIHISKAYPQLGFEYLGICRLCLDGARDGSALLDDIHKIYQEQPFVEKMTTWLYYPVGEKAGDLSVSATAHISIAYANAVAGQEDEFREWYTTQHIRHALIIPALVTGQVFELTGFQNSPETEPRYKTIALYEMGDSPESLMESIPSINPEDLVWSPSGDTRRFTEWFYTLL